MAVIYRISELAADLAVTTRTIRFYEEQGLIAPARRGHERIYTPHERRLLRIALTGKQLGLPLAECRELLALYQHQYDNSNTPLHEQLERIQHYQQFLSDQKRAIVVLNETLTEIRQHCEAAQRLRSAVPTSGETLTPPMSEPTTPEASLTTAAPLSLPEASLVETSSTSTHANTAVPIAGPEHAKPSTAPVKQKAQRTQLSQEDDLFAGQDDVFDVPLTDSLNDTNEKVRIEEDGQLGFLL